MESFSARYVDGEVAASRLVSVRLYQGGAAGRLDIADAASGKTLDSWPADTLFPVPAARGALRIGATGRPYGARLAFSGSDTAQRLRALLPALARRQSESRGKQLRIMGFATAALASVIAAYVYGVPLVAANVAAMVPPAWEARLGETVAAQVEAALDAGAGFEVCDPDPDSLANRAIARFATSAMAGTGSTFTPAVTVVRSSIPNAFALPGGQAFYFSALLDKTETADEFAGVLAHELGHVVHRHGLETLIATSATGLLVGFVLGDLTGLSVAGGVGAALIDSRFSRDAERQADRFATDSARRLGFSPAGLAALLTRLEGDASMSAASALLSTHPLTAERRLALEAAGGTETGLSPAFTAIEWRAIKAMCGTGKPAAPREELTAEPAAPVERVGGRTGRRGEWVSPP